MSLHGWIPEITRDGSWTLRHPEHGEACHSEAGAWLEARERYVIPCELEARARQGPMRLLDVGTGPGINLAAALAAVEENGGLLFAASLELERSVLSATLDWCADASHAGPGEHWHREVRRALELALASGAEDVEVPLGDRSQLRLLLGDARETLPALDPEVAFDAVFLDPFSPARAPDLWEEAFLAAIARRMAPLALLSTYSARYGVRLALARAGLEVGLGPRVASKAEGTLASPTGGLPALPEKVQNRLRRDLDAPSEPILGHPLRERPPGID